MSTAATPRRQASFRPVQPVQPAISSALDLQQLRQQLGQLQRLEGKAASLLWGLPPQCERRAAQRLVGDLFRGTVSAARRKQVESVAAHWLARSEIDAATAWEGLALLLALPCIAPLLDDKRLLQLWERWLELSNLAAKDAWDDDPVRFALLAIETPLQMAALSGSNADLRARPRAAWEELAAGWLGEQGLPAARYLPAMRPVLASCTRSVQADPSLLAGERRVSYVGLLHNAIRLTDASGREAFTRFSDSPFLDCLKAGIGLAKDRDAAALYQLLLDNPSRMDRVRGANLSPSVYDEPREIALLCSSLSAESPRITLAFDRPELQLELLGDRPLISGPWTAALTVDGERIIPHAIWEEVCRYEDEDVEYLELETAMRDGWILQRHLLLARKEGFALLADSVLGEREAIIGYESSLALYPGVCLRSEHETHEAWLSVGPKRYLVLPLALPEWRSDRPLGELKSSDQRMTLTTSARRARNLFHPLLIPLAGSRRTAEYTWRHLTVGQALEIQPLDVAAAYRVQLGDRQWVVYRALTRGNRTFLGKNLTSELFVGVFHRNGETDTIMEVE